MQKERAVGKLSYVFLAVAITLLTFSLILTIQSSNAQSQQQGLCLHPNNPALCTVVNRESCCPAGQSQDECIRDYFRPGLNPDQSELCQFGYCIYSCQANVYKQQCDDPYEPIDFITPITSMTPSQAALCEQGCCISNINNNLDCRETTNNACAQNLAVPNGQFVSWYKTGTYNNCANFCLPGANKPTGNLIVRVKSNTQNPVQDALVQVAGKKALTDVTGEARLEVAATEQTLKVEKNSFNTIFQTITVSEGETKTVDVVLTASNKAEVTGIVKDSAGNRLEGVLVSYDGKESITNGLGVYTINEINVPKTSNLRASFQGYAAYEESRTFTTARTYSVNITLSGVPVCLINQPLSSNQARGNSCLCGSSSLSTSDSGYCCLNVQGQPSYSGVSCSPERTLSGRVKNNITQQPIQGATVIATRQGVSEAGATNGLGEYSLSVPSGNYNIRVQANNYLDFTSTINVEQDRTLDVNLTPSLGACDAATLPQITFTGRNVRGKTDLELSWQDSCSNVARQYILYKSNTNKIIDVFSNKTSSYTHKGLEWGVTYNYTLLVIYTDNRVGSKNLSINTGNIFCNNKLDGMQFCLDTSFSNTSTPIYRMKCDENNQITSADDFYNCSIERPGSVCVGPDQNQKTYCQLAISCSSPKQGEQNPFGIFYNKQTCLFDSANKPNFCFYDYSSTIIDKCYSCTQASSCYDYKSEEACNSNTCLVGGGNCKWKETEYLTLNKGICYQENYKGTDKCGLCTPGSPLFQNTQCTQEKCSLLGSCFSDGKSCQACQKQSGATTCEDLKNEKACIGTGKTEPELNIPEDATPEEREAILYLNSTCPSQPEFIKQFPRSLDACSLSTCSWNTTACFKDGNFDNKADCGLSETGCRTDHEAPRTEAEIPSFVSNSSHKITLIISDNSDGLGTNTSYCFGKYCCPARKARPVSSGSNKREITVSDSFGNLTQEAKQGLNIIGYYSIDRYSNIEYVKYKSFYVDTMPPNISINYTVTNSTQQGLSDITIEASLDEWASCNGRITNDQSLYQIEDEIGTRQGGIENGKKFFAKYRNAQDYTYDFYIYCTDVFGNKNSPETGNGYKSIEVDRNNFIISASPKNKTIKADEVELKVKTSDPLSCTLKDETTQNSNYFEFSEGRQRDNPNPAIPSNYTYTHRLGNLESKSYSYEIRCLEGVNLADTGRIFFTIDNAAPQTSLYAEFSGSPPSLEPFDNRNPVPYGIANIALVCKDTELAGKPGPFGCQNTVWCFDESADCSNFAPYTRSLNLSNLGGQQGGRGRLCFKSTDKGSNEEVPQCKTLLRDESPPFFLENVSVKGDVMRINSTFFRTISNKVNVTGRLNEQTRVFITVYSNKRSRDIIKAQEATTRIVSGETIFDLEIELNDIANSDKLNLYEIKATAIDNGGMEAESKAYIFYDNRFPNITSIKPSPLAANTQTPHIQVTTAENSSCTFHYPITINGQLITERFNSEDGKNHSITISPTRRMPYVSEPTTFNIRINCTDSLNGKNTLVSSGFVIDKRAPEIVEFELQTNTPHLREDGNSKDYMLVGILTSSFRIKASELVRCKYSENFVDYGAMENNFTGFESLQQETITNFISFQDLRNYSYHMSCADAAGNNASTKTINIETDQYAKIRILETKPEEFVNTKQPIISLNTIVQARCALSRGEGGVVFFKEKDGSFTNNNAEMRSTFIGDKFMHLSETSSLSNTRADLNENEMYIAVINCTDPLDRFRPEGKIINFTPDTIPPEITDFIPSQDIPLTESSILEASGKTEKFSKIKFYINDALARESQLGDEREFKEMITLNNGTNKLMVVAYDRAQNNYSIRRLVNYSNTGPGVVRVIPNSGIFKRLDNITAILKDNGAGISGNSYINVTGPNGAVSVNKIFSGDKIIAKLPQLTNGDYNAIVMPIDPFGRHGQAEIIEFSIDNNAMEMAVLSPEHGLLTNSHQINFEVQINKGDKTLDSIRLFLNNKNYTIKRNKDDNSFRQPQAGQVETYRIVQTAKDGLNKAWFEAKDTEKTAVKSEQIFFVVDNETLIPTIRIEFNPEEAAELLSYKCELPANSGLECLDVKITQSKANLKIRNKLDKTVNNLDVGICGGLDTKTIKKGETADFEITCPQSVLLQKTIPLLISSTSLSSTGQRSYQISIIASVKT